MNRTFLRFLSVLALLVFVVFSGCSKKSSSSNPLTPGNVTGGGTITLNGGGYTNATVNFTTGVGAYLTSDKMTNCIFYGKVGADSILVLVGFAGTSTGNYQWQDFTQSSTNFNGVAVNIYNNAAGVNKYFVPKSGGNTNVTTFGSVGQTIEGSYSGSTIDVATSETITVTGSFKATRGPDE